MWWASLPNDPPGQSGPTGAYAHATMPVAEALTLEELERDPYPALARLRHEAPVCFAPRLDLWLVTRWDDVAHVLGRPETFTAATAPSWLATVLGPNMLTADGADHRRQKGAFEPHFQATSSGASGRFAATRLPALCHELVDGFAADGSVELMSAYCEPIAVMALQEVLGLRTCTWQELGAWCRGVCAGLANFENEPEPAAVADRAKAELGDAVRAAVADAPERSTLAHLRDHLTPDEIVNNVRLLVSGGINEPRDGIGLVVWALLSHPDQLDAVRASPPLLRRAVEETFRWVTPVGTATRQVVHDTELAGVGLPAGDLLAAVLTSANRDERRFSEPDRFDVHRREGAHLAFSSGAHHCLGSWLGRQQVRVGVEVLLERLPQLELAEPPTVHGFEFRGPTELRLRWPR